MQRRTFLGALPLLPTLATLDSVAPYRRYPATDISQPMVSIPEGKVIPLGLDGFAVDRSGETVLRFPQPAKRDDDLVFRLTAALDFREWKIVELFIAGTDRTIGRLDMRYAHPFQPFQVRIGKALIDDIARRGIALKLTKGNTPAWFLKGEQLPADADGLLPQLLTDGSGRRRAFWDALYSMNSFSPFGWMGGCVMDALYELHLRGEARATETLTTQLSHFLDDKRGVVFENPVTRPLGGRYNSIEDFLPLAAIVGLYPRHFSVQKAVDFCLAHRNAEGAIVNGALTTEGCYTVAYPLAAIARRRDDAALAQIALDQLIHRGNRLVDSTAVYQRINKDGARAYQNWGRGVAWYLLGTVKALALLEGGNWKLNGIEQVRQRWEDTARMVVGLADPNELWYAFIDRPATLPDASASAGITAALAWGRRFGYLSGNYRPSADNTFASLCDYLTVDGFLGQITQINRGGEELQESGYRVIAQFGMGLMAQLAVAGD